MFKDTNQNVQTFNNSQFGNLRVSQSNDGKIWFCLSDVCFSLGIGNASQTKSRLKHEGITTNDTPTTSGVQSMIFIDEPNLYRCIFQSRKKEAEEFQDWVCGEVLPSIRKTGGYLSISPGDTPEEIMARALTIAHATLEKREERLKYLEFNNANQAKQIEQLQPKAELADKIIATPDKVFKKNTILFAGLKNLCIFAALQIIIYYAKGVFYAKKHLYLKRIEKLYPCIIAFGE